MKKFLLKFLLLFCFLVIIPAIHASYDGPVFKEQMPVDEESRSFYYRHDSVKWGGPGNLACASRLNVRYRDYYHKQNPRVIISDKTTSY